MQDRSLVVHHLARSRHILRVGVALLKQWRIHARVLMHHLILMLIRPTDGAPDGVGMDSIPGGILGGSSISARKAIPLETAALGPSDGGEASLLLASPLAPGRIILLLPVELLQVGRLAHLIEPLVGDVDLGLEVAVPLPPLLVLDAEDVVLLPDGFVGLHGLGEAGAGYRDHLGRLGGILVGFLDLMLEGGIFLATGRKEPPALVTLLLEVLDLLHLTDLQLSGFVVGEMACDENSGAYK